MDLKGLLAFMKRFNIHCRKTMWLPSTGRRNGLYAVWVMLQDCRNSEEFVYSCACAAKDCGAVSVAPLLSVTFRLILPE